MTGLFSLTTILSNILGYAYNSDLRKSLVVYHKMPPYNFTGCEIKVEVGTNHMLSDLYLQDITSREHYGTESVRAITDDMPGKNVTLFKTTGRFVDVVTRSSQCQCPVCPGFEYRNTHDFTGCTIEGSIKTSTLKTEWLDLVYNNPDFHLNSIIIIPTFFQKVQAVKGGQSNCDCTCPNVQTEESIEYAADVQGWIQSSISVALATPLFIIYLVYKKRHPGDNHGL